MPDDDVTLQECYAMLEAERSKRQQLETIVDKQKEQIEEQTQAIQQLQQQQTALLTRYEQIAGIADGEETTATKRRRDLFLTLQRKADRNGGVYAMDYNHIKDDLAAHNHGSITDAQAYRDLRWIAENVQGCSTTTHAVTGNEAVQINLDQTNSNTLVSSDGSNIVSRTSTGGAGSDQQNTDLVSVKQT